MTLTRADDEQTLSMLAMRCDGVPGIRIAYEMDTHPRNVCTRTLKVLRADLAESGERRRDVLAGYPIMGRFA